MFVCVVVAYGSPSEGSFMEGSIPQVILQVNIHSMLKPTEQQLGIETYTKSMIELCTCTFKSSIACAKHAPVMLPNPSQDSFY